MKDMPNEEQLVLPGFEDLAKDAERHAEDKRLKKEILKLVTEMTSQEKAYNSPAKLATWERNLKVLMKAREAIWKTKENEGG